jgi:hypothetical protein
MPNRSWTPSSAKASSSAFRQASSSTSTSPKPWMSPKRPSAAPLSFPRNRLRRRHENHTSTSSHETAFVIPRPLRRVLREQDASLRQRRTLTRSPPQPCRGGSRSAPRNHQSLSAGPLRGPLPSRRHARGAHHLPRGDHAEVEARRAEHFVTRLNLRLKYHEHYTLD